ncbi:hypothetical protein K438DRAFT_901976 [Mycena galopus ATCC 62051]|nr:hypothetical protein K438DRAFT_901976 [Mycena galopus ATCC 62051]
MRVNVLILSTLNHVECQLSYNSLEHNTYVLFPQMTLNSTDLVEQGQITTHGHCVTNMVSKFDVRQEIQWVQCMFSLSSFHGTHHNHMSGFRGINTRHER